MKRVAAASARCGFCGKLVYPSRKIARRMANRRHPGERMTAYRCTAGPRWANRDRWHLGHFDAYARRVQSPQERRPA